MNKEVIISNGVGSIDLINGNYNVSGEVNGYNNSTLNPSTINVVEGENEYSFTIAAEGVLTLHVSEEGTASSTPIVGAKFIRVDSEGNEYGSEITSDSEGNAVFNNVPYAEHDAPIIYYKQTAGDGSHEFVSTVQSTTLTTDAQTVEVENPLGDIRTIRLLDANYANLPIDSATLSLTN